LDETGVDTAIDELFEAMEDRALRVRSYKADDPSQVLFDEPLLIMVIENRSAIDYITKNSELLSKFKDILNRCGGLKICVLFSNVENANVGFNAPEITKLIKNNKKVVVFSDVADFKFVDTTVQQQKRNAKALKLGDAFMCFDNRIDRIRTIYQQ
jgi:S-DNA-T family DNA segregation ATPase FtsK/SpoIIIE